VYTAPVAPSEWSRVRIVVGTKIALFSKTIRPALGNGVLYLDKIGRVRS